MQKLIGMGLVLVGMAGTALAGTVGPEIDAGAAGAALALISGGLVVLRARRRK